MRLLFTLSVVLPTVLSAQPPLRLAVGARRSAPSVAAPAKLMRAEPSDSTPPAPRRHVKRAALIGAGVGLLAGAIGGTQIGVGCDVAAGDGCSTGRTRAGLMLFFGAEGAVAGAGVGALVGLLLPKSWHRPR